MCDLRHVELSCSRTGESYGMTFKSVCACSPTLTNVFDCAMQWPGMLQSDVMLRCLL